MIAANGDGAQKELEQELSANAAEGMRMEEDLEDYYPSEDALFAQDPDDDENMVENSDDDYLPTSQGDGYSPQHINALLKYSLKSLLLNRFPSFEEEMW